MLPKFIEKQEYSWMHFKSVLPIATKVPAELLPYFSAVAQWAEMDIQFKSEIVIYRFTAMVLTQSIRGPLKQ